MITGNGIDIVYIPRIRRILEEHGDRFVRKILSDKEISAIPQTRREEYIAGRFAAKEALAKATAKKFSLSEVSVINDERGKPAFTDEFFRTELADSRVHLSISHDNDYATAFVIIENLEDGK